MKIGLYIPCFNAEQYIGEVIEAVLKQSLTPDELLVVDDASTDNTPAIVSHYAVRLIRHTHNRGLAASRNTAIKNMKAEFIASLDADCIPEHNWLKQLMHRFHSSKGAGVGGRLLETYPSTIFDMWRAVHMRQYWEHKTTHPRFLFGSNTVFRKEAITKVGYYDERFTNNYEDVDICYRLKKKGYTLAYEPKAVAHHLKHDDISSLLNNYWKWNLGYYQKRKFYSSAGKFAFKIKDNIGLANRYIEEDMAAERHQFLYIDFLLALHHCLRDFEYFISQDQESKKTPNDLLSFWLSLVDLTFFYHFDSEKPNVNTVVSKNHTFIQNFFALNLLVSKIITEIFSKNQIKNIVFKHLLISVYNISDNRLLEKLLTLVELHPNWDGLLAKKHARLSGLFLQRLCTHFKKWLHELGGRFNNIISMIEIAAVKTEALSRY